MKKILNTILVLIFIVPLSISSVFGQVYSRLAEYPMRYNTAPNATTGTPKIIVDDILIPIDLVGANQYFQLTQATFGIRRAANAAPTTIRVYIAPVDEAATTYENVIKLPMQYVGEKTLGLNYFPALITSLVSFGNQIAPIASVKLTTDDRFPNYAAFFIGISLTNWTENGWRVATNPDYNLDGFWVVDSVAATTDGPLLLSPIADPEGAFYVQVFGSFSSTIPVTWLSFSAESADDNGGVRLRWATAQELNCQGFDIERSTDGVHFDKIGYQKGNGSTEKRSDYAFIDAQAADGDNYYRLRQTDFDGKITLSNVAFARIKSAIGVQVFPNPIVEKRGQIRLSLPTAAHLSGDLFDVNGRLVRRVFDNNFAEGVNEIPLETDAATGIYFLDIRKNGQVVAHKKVFINH